MFGARTTPNWLCRTTQGCRPATNIRGVKRLQASFRLPSQKPDRALHRTKKRRNVLRSRFHFIACPILLYLASACGNGGVANQGRSTGIVQGSTSPNAVEGAPALTTASGNPQPAYVFADLTPTGSNFSFPTSLNTSGQVIGDWAPSSWCGYLIPHGGVSAPSGVDCSGLAEFLYSGGTWTTGGVVSSISFINDSGQMVGVSGGHAFLYSNGTMTDLGALPGDDMSTPTAINDAGQVAGYSWYSLSSTGARHAFLYSRAR